MKLIKLSSPTSGEFENLFNTDILIEPNSKVGLVSASVQLSDKTITIDSTNNLLEFRTQKKDGAVDRVYYDVNIETGFYTQTSFLKELTRAMNSALNNDVETSATIQWRCVMDDAKLVMEMRRGAYNVDVVVDDLSRVEDLTYNAAAKSYTKSSAGEDNDAFAVSKNYFTSGCGQADYIVALQTTKFALGLIQAPPNPNTTTLDPTDYDYVCYTETGKANYQISSADGVVDTGVAQEDGVSIIMELTLGKLNFIKKKDDDEVTLKSFDWDFTTRYHLAFNVRSGVVTNLQWSPDPFVEVQDDLYLYPKTLHNDTIIYDPLSFIVGAPPTRSVASLTFKQKPNTGVYLGYHESSYEMPGSGINFIVSAEEELSEAVSFTDLLVEIPSLTMESYDGTLSKRRNVISYIPSLEVTNSELTFFNGTPIMIDLNNASKFNLNRVQVRLLTSSEHDVQIESSSIVILIGNTF